MLLFLFSSLPLITHLSFSPPPSSCPACCFKASPPGKEGSHQPMTPCWDMWHFCSYTSYLPKLACITLSHEQSDCEGGWRCAQGERRTKTVQRERDRVAPCLGKQVLPGWIWRGFWGGHSGSESSYRRLVGQKQKKCQEKDFRKTHNWD